MGDIPRNVRIVFQMFDLKLPQMEKSCEVYTAHDLDVCYILKLFSGVFRKSWQTLHKHICHVQPMSIMNMQVQKFMQVNIIGEKITRVIRSVYTMLLNLFYSIDVHEVLTSCGCNALIVILFCTVEY